MTILVIVESDTPDLSGNAPVYAPVLASLGAESRVVSPYVAPATAGDFEGADGVVFTGSGAPFGTGDPEAAPLRAAMALAFEAGLPAFGSCNGMNLAASLLGGETGPSPNGYEVPLARDLELTEAGRAHPMMAGRPLRFSAPCIHFHEIRALPDGMTVLAGNAHTPVQAVAYEQGGVSFWGTQYHPEFSLSVVARAMERKGLGAPETWADLHAAESDPAAAARLGAGAELRPETRVTELRNWVARIAG